MICLVRPRHSTSSSNADSQTTKSTDDSAAIRAKLHQKVFGTEHAPPNVQRTSPQALSSPASEQIISCWVPPRMHIVQFFAGQVIGFLSLLFICSQMGILEMKRTKLSMIRMMPAPKMNS